MFYDNEPKYRQEEIKSLIQSLKDPGKFSILLLGKRGTGKSHWLQQIYDHRDEVKASDCFSTIHTVNGVIAKDYGKKDWEKHFKQANNGLLIVDEVEELNKASQAILFEFLSTVDGKYGLDKKEYCCRIVFVSTFDIKTLRDTEQYLSHKFYDRISQLVVQLPSFEDKNKNIIADFQATWKKMTFPDNELPNDLFNNWLNDNSHKFYGNFRDLDKLAINWRNCQISGIEKDKIFEKVTKEFFEIYHFPKHDSENNNAFYINADMDFYKDMQPNFKNFVKGYAKKLYGEGYRIAPERKPFGVPYRTMDRW
ncbi:hypothetical protein FACS189411_05260 [Bacteroidia bacterium]|nr:hypothetical protein FACS189411_05260 [Bacteroidia bacterium]